MENCKVDFNDLYTDIKCLNAVNNGPAGGVRGLNNHDAWREARIPYSRLHDSAFYSQYGGDYSVDVHRIFRNFDADVDDPASYDFEPTDKYLESIVSVGTKIFYRLGAAIEHYQKVGTHVPKDYLKWAKICEHIIRHYNEGWANGLELGIEYWEIWNEPDCRNADGSNPCWQGTNEQFFDFYEVVAKHLKAQFPSLKIGGPAICCYSDFCTTFFPEMQKRNVPFDFISWHWYGSDMESLKRNIRKYNALFESSGYGDVETILNEWNYVRGWLGKDWRYSLECEKNYKGASFIAAVMSVVQTEKLDKLMYYDAGPCGMNGIFDDYLCKRKGYYPIYMAGQLSRLGKSARVTTPDDLYAIAAWGENEGAVMMTYYTDDDNAEEKLVKVDFARTAGKTLKAEYYIVDENNDMTLLREEYFTADDFATYIKMKPLDIYYIKFTEQ